MKPEKVIVLQGVAGIGKTTTLKVVIDLLKQQGGKVTVLYKERIDVTAKVDFNGKTVGICTSGDSLDCIKYGYDLLGPDCDIYIFATRTKGEAVDFVQDTFSKCPIIWHAKWYVLEYSHTCVNISTLRDEVNKLQADVIIRSI